MFEAVGHHVEKIKRVRYGPLTLDVPPGKFRSLTLKEIERLKTASTTGAAGGKRSVS
jgi:23S rRNA pseudouridine2605 synthase